MHADYPYPRLVRVVWKHRQTRAWRAFVASNFAYDVEHARDIGEAILIAMVPCTQPLNIAMQVAVLGRQATRADATNQETPWESFYSEALNQRALPAPKAGKKKSASGAR